TKGFPPAAIQTGPHFTDNPADYGDALPFLRRLLAALRDEPSAAGATFHLALTGGTPALTAALLIEGVGTFGAAARVHYVDRRTDSARSLDVVRDLQAQALRRALRAQVGAHAY